jgi:hypothetical protein
MAKHSDHLAHDFETENTGGVLSGFLAEEDDFDRRSLWRLGSWGVAAVGAVIVAVLANQSSIGWRRDQVALADLSRQARQAQQLQWIAKESQDEARRLASAVDTLNGDRDRLYSRLTVLEQNLDSVTGSIARQTSPAGSPQAVPVPAASAPAEPLSTAQNPEPPVVAAPATTAASRAEKPLASQATAPLMASKSIMAPPDSAAGRLIEPEPPRVITAEPMPEVVGSISPPREAGPDRSGTASPEIAVLRTEFAVDVGGARSVSGLRALWRGLLKTNSTLAALRPVIAVKESDNGLGMTLRLVAGPLFDAAAAAKVCAALAENQRPCETTVFDGQRLAMKADDTPASIRPAPRRRSSVRRPAANAEPSQKPETSALSSLFGKRQGP